MTCRSKSLAALALAALAFALPAGALARPACDPLRDCAPVPGPPPINPAPNNPVDGRLCLTDTLALDVPSETPVVWADEAPIEAIRAGLEVRANDLLPVWFCPAEAWTGAGCDRGRLAPGAPGLPARVQVEVHAVLDARVNAARADGHLRFFRFELWGFDGLDGRARRIELNPAAVCDAVATLRAIALRTLPVQEPTALRVGRACEVTGAQDGPPGAGGAETWHLDRIGVAPRLELGRPRGRGPRAQVALIDGAVERLVARRLGVRVHAHDLLIPLDRDRRGRPRADFPHGTAMALLVREVAPNARLHAFPVFDAQGVAPIWAVARAVDNALFSRAIPARRPLFINLSLGFRPELAQPARLGGDVSSLDPGGALGVVTVEPGACETWEDGAGEPLRYVLEVARRLDVSRDATGRRGRGPGGPITIIASAGNFHSWDGSEPEDIVGVLDPVGVASGYSPCVDYPRGELDQPILYPAQWSNDGACPALAFPISGVDSTDGSSATTRLLAETPLVAPGDLVTVRAGAAWAGRVPAPPAARCAGDPTPVDPEAWRFYLPFTLSGSSVAAALTSGAAARAYDVRVARNRARRAVRRRRRPRRLPELTRGAFQRLLYLTGERVADPGGAGCRLTHQFRTGIPVRRLSVVRMEAALRCERAADLIDCLVAAPADISREDAADCAPLLYGPAGCLGEAADACPGELEAPVSPELAALAVCPASFDGAPFTPCNADDCGEDAAVPGSPALGSAGPQPGGGGCEDCRLYEHVTAGGTLTFLGRFWGGKTGTSFESPVLRLSWPAYGGAAAGTAWRWLSSPAIRPGGSAYVAGISNPLPAIVPLKYVRAELILVERTATSVSKLYTNLGAISAY